MKRAILYWAIIYTIVFCVSYTIVSLYANHLLAGIKVEQQTYTKPLEVGKSDKQAPQIYNEQPADTVQRTDKPQVTKQVQVTATPPQIEQATVITQECQYPDRYYPDGSCNNSDPACPETIKDPVLKGDCPL